MSDNGLSTIFKGSASNICKCSFLDSPKIENQWYLYWSRHEYKYQLSKTLQWAGPHNHTGYSQPHVAFSNCSLHLVTTRCSQPHCAFTNHLLLATTHYIECLLNATSGCKQWAVAKCNEWLGASSGCEAGLWQGFS